MNQNLSGDQFGYTVVTYHADKAGKPRAKARGTYEYDEDATAAAHEIATSDGTVVPNADAPDSHPRYGEYSHSAFQDGNRMAAVFRRGPAKYRN